MSYLPEPSPAQDLHDALVKAADKLIEHEGLLDEALAGDLHSAIDGAAWALCHLDSAVRAASAAALRKASKK